MKQNDSPAHPGRLLSPRDESVGKARMDLFIAQRDTLKGYFAGEIAPAEYAPEWRKLRPPVS